MIGLWSHRIRRGYETNILDWGPVLFELRRVSSRSSANRQLLFG